MHQIRYCMFILFIYSGHFYSAPSSHLLLRGAPDYSTDTVSEFHAEAHRQLHVKDLSKVPMWRPERESNPRPSGWKSSSQPRRHHVPQRQHHCLTIATKYYSYKINGPIYFSVCCLFLEPIPICNTLWGEEVVETTCLIDFQGDWAPTMEWRRYDGTVVTANVSLSIDRVTSTITRKQNGCNNIECYKVTVCFKEDGRPLGIDAINIPVYSRSTYVNESIYVRCKHCVLIN